MSVASRIQSERQRSERSEVGLNPQELRLTRSDLCSRRWTSRSRVSTEGQRRITAVSLTEGRLDTASRRDRPRVRSIGSGGPFGQPAASRGSPPRARPNGRPAPGHRRRRRLGARHGQESGAAAAAEATTSRWRLAALLLLLLSRRVGASSDAKRRETSQRSLLSS